MQLYLHIALKHLLARKRQSLVSLSGIMLGVAFFLAISALMQGSEKDFIRRLIDNAPHITVSDEFRSARPQPVFDVYTEGAVDIRNVKPLTESRGIRGYHQLVNYLRAKPGVQASSVLSGQGVVSFAGRDAAIAMEGMVPDEIKDVVTIQNYMVKGSIDDLVADPNGIVIGEEMARILSLSMGDTINIASASGQVRNFKILGMYRTGRLDYDSSHAFVSLKRIQALLNRPNRVNRIIVKLPNPNLAREVAADLERRSGYKSVSWQEASEDILSTLVIRNIIMYTVVSAVLVVAAFGIYNVISTVVLEKRRDIAILKSMGFRAPDIRMIFLIQGVILGILGCLSGLPLGSMLMFALQQITFKPPGASQPIQMPIDWGVLQFIIAGSFAMTASVLAALLPARKAAQVQPVDILRGAQ